MSLQEYQAKRDFTKTTEPRSGKSSQKEPIFVVQEHHASHLHYDFRLEAFGTLKSWAIPKGPSSTIGEKRLAVEVEDHPIGYATFKGRIPEGQYGAGLVKIWDHGTWQPPKNLRRSLSDGHLEFELKGGKLKGRWLLQRTGKLTGKKRQWLLIKRHDLKELKKVRAIKNKDLSFEEGISPQLAELVAEVPKGDNWVHEIKFDGYRTLSYLKDAQVKLLSRNQLDWTERYPTIHAALKKLKVESAVLDGEIVALDREGRSSFADLQAALKNADYSRMVYYIFDLLFLNGYDLRNRTLMERKELLQKLLGQNKTLVFSEHFETKGEDLLHEACQRGLEGIVSKNRNGHYLSKRSPDWKKIKCSQRQEFVIGGFTSPKGSRQGIGALLMGSFEGEGFRYVGRVGTGFNSLTLQDLAKRLVKIKQPRSPFTTGSPAVKGDITWVEPTLVAEVEFKTWTKDRLLRHASYQGLREDKSAQHVHVETPKSQDHEGFRITHPDRIIYENANVHKIDVANYYKSVAPWMMPFVASRPLALVRCPDGTSGSCFFQKHLDSSKFDELFDGEIDGEEVIFIKSEAGLLQMVQWGVLEIHTWQTHMENPKNADQIIFDFDPDEGLSWSKVTEAAFRVRDMLSRLRLKCFVKTTGGKGLHVHVPIDPRYEWERSKAFAKAICLQLESESPKEFTATSSKKKREGKIYLDYLRNGMGSTAVAPYSLRNRDEPYVATPLTWEELESLKSPKEFQMSQVLKRLAQKKPDPWKGYHRLRQTIKIL